MAFPEMLRWSLPGKDTWLSGVKALWSTLERHPGWLLKLSVCQNFRDDSLRVRESSGDLQVKTKNRITVSEKRYVSVI